MNIQFILHSLFQICESNCLENYVSKLCECSMNGKTSDTKLCLMSRVSDCTYTLYLKKK